MACRRLQQLLKKLVISIPELARYASLSEKAVRNIIEGKNKPRTQTQRAIIGAVNQELAKRDLSPVGPEIFD